MLRGQPVELFALRPERMSVVAAADGWPSGLHVQGWRAKADDPGAGRRCVAQSHTLNLPFPSGGRPLRRRVPERRRSGDRHPQRRLANWNRQLLENAARSFGRAGIRRRRQRHAHARSVRSPQGRAYPRVRRASQCGSADAARRRAQVAVDEQCAAADMDFATLKAAAARDIALAFGVPPMLLGLPGDSTYANLPVKRTARCGGLPCCLWRPRSSAALGEGPGALV